MATNKEKKVEAPEEEEKLSDSAEDVSTADDNADDDASSDADSDAGDDNADDDADRIEEEPAKAPTDVVASKPARSSGKNKPARLQPEPEEEAVEKKVDTDYLRQYQYKKVNDVPSIGAELGDRAYLTDPDKGSRAEKMKRHLLVQPRVRILVPRSAGEHASVLMTVNLNGYRLDFPKNTYIEMPEQIAEVIMQSQAQTDVALQAFRIDGNSKKTEALG